MTKTISCAKTECATRPTLKMRWARVAYSSTATSQGATIDRENKTGNFTWCKTAQTKSARAALGLTSVVSDAKFAVNNMGARICPAVHHDPGLLVV